jgi:hypothetical protein
MQGNAIATIYGSSKRVVSAIITTFSQKFTKQVTFLGDVPI